MNHVLKTKDLIAAGVFGAMYIVVLMATVTLIGFIPITYIMAPFFGGITCGGVYMLYIMRVPKKGAILILSGLVGFVLSSSTLIAGVWAVLCGILAEFVIHAGSYKSKKHYAWSYSIFACSTIGPFLAILFMKERYLESVVKYYGTVYASQLDRLTPSWIIFVLIGLGLIGGYIGSKIGFKLLDKHFKKVGLV